MANGSRWIDTTYIEIRGAWKYVYRAVDSEDTTPDFMLNANRDRQAATR